MAMEKKDPRGILRRVSWRHKKKKSGLDFVTTGAAQGIHHGTPRVEKFGGSGTLCSTSLQKIRLDEPDFFRLGKSSAFNGRLIGTPALARRSAKHEDGSGKTAAA